VVLHHQIRVTAGGFADLKDTDDIRMPGEPSHRTLLAQEALSALVGLGSEDLDSDDPVKRDLGAPVDNAETAAADLFGVVESGPTQFRGDGEADVALRSKWIAFHHRLPAMS
jgi:hypothetical protein